MTPKKRNRNLTSQIYQSQIQQSTSSGSDPDQKVRNSRISQNLMTILSSVKKRLQANFEYVGVVLSRDIGLLNLEIRK